MEEEDWKEEQDRQSFEDNREFYESYQYNINNILTYARTESGRHPINPAKAKLWIESQVNESRRRAAQNLINHTHYITFDRVMGAVKQLIFGIYQQVDPNNVVLFTDGQNKSTYFLAVLAVQYIRELEYPDPQIAIGTLYEDGSLLSRFNRKHIIIMDDMAYTGSHITTILDTFAQKQDDGQPYITDASFYVGLVGCTARAARVLSPYNIELYVDMWFDSLVGSVGEREFLELSYYFAPADRGYPMVSVYFDHKMADMVSTFSLTLLYGPVLPCNLGYPINSVIYGIANSLTQTDLTTLAERRSPRKEQAYRVIIDQIIQDDAECDYNRDTIGFVSFIEGCRDLNSEDYLNTSYYEFIRNYNRFEDIIQAASHCLYPFYKTGPYAML